MFCPPTSSPAAPPSAAASEGPASNRSSHSVERSHLTEIFDLMVPPAQAGALTRLAPSLPPLGPSLAAKVHDCQGLTALRQLDLSHHHIEDVGATYLADAPHLRSLRGLRLADCDLGGMGAVAIIGAEPFTGLTLLDLSHNRIGQIGCLAWGTASGLSLREMNFTCALRAPDTYQAASLPTLKDWRRHLTILLMPRQAAHFAHLRRLHLAGNHLGNGIVLQLADCRSLHHLVLLDLRENDLNELGANALLAEDILLHALQDLYLNENFIPDAYLERIRQCASFPCLRALSCARTYAAPSADPSTAPSSASSSASSSTPSNAGALPEGELLPHLPRQQPTVRWRRLLAGRQRAASYLRRLHQWRMPGGCFR